VYTLPSKLRDIAYQNKRVVYDLQMKAAAETMLAIAADPKRLGARLVLASRPPSPPGRKSNPHSARGTAGAKLPATSCLGAFWTPAASVRGTSPHAGVLALTPIGVTHGPPSGALEF
jgi:hypothetical protein